MKNLAQFRRHCVCANFKLPQVPPKAVRRMRGWGLAGLLILGAAIAGIILTGKGK